jgi:hypothetical protein|tara:strand:+ start:78 stop:281 length:204 start_codon:yes stop_codon:yes gene_type:complete
MLIRLLIVLLFVSSCTFKIRNKDSIIEVDELPKLQDTIKSVDCDVEILTDLDFAKCQMETRLLELEY